MDQNNESKGLKIFGIINIILTFFGWVLIVLFDSLLSSLVIHFLGEVPYWAKAVGLFPMFIPPLCGFIGITISIMNKNSKYKKFCMISSLVCFIVNWIVTQFFVLAMGYIQ